jgi:tetratricopeptide (TPR) repeat protein
MKAEHRKELQTNALANSMGRLYEEIRGRPQSASIAVWVLGVLAVVLFVVWYFSINSSRSRSDLWVQIETDSYVKSPPEAMGNFAAIAKDSPKTIPGRTARFQEARLLLPQNLQLLGTSERAQAIDQLTRARALYNQLATETGDDPLLRQEALFGAAKAEEALIGAPSKDKPDQTLGSLDKALELYRKAADVSADSYVAKQAQAHVKQLEENRAAVEKFYVELNKLASAAPAPTPVKP